MPQQATTFDKHPTGSYGPWGGTETTANAFEFTEDSHSATVRTDDDYPEYEGITVSREGHDSRKRITPQGAQGREHGYSQLDVEDPYAAESYFVEYDHDLFENLVLPELPKTPPASAGSVTVSEAGGPGDGQ